MALALLAVLGLAWWLHREGLLIPNLLRLGGAAVAALLAVRLFTSGRLLSGIAVAAIGVGWWLWQARAPASGPLAAAARLLRVDANAPSEVIWQAWRQAMASAHPDAGGSDAQAQALTQARDLLVAAAEKRRQST